MIHRVQGRDPAFCPLLESMHADRKRVFVDLLGWDVPVSDQRFEIDQFDDAYAVYLIAVDTDGGHAGSLRLLPSLRPHILGSLFPQLCAEGVPVGPDIFEITRLCLPTRLGAAERLRVRNHLISAMVDHALDAGIRSLTGVVETGFLTQILAMGWQCTALTPVGSALGGFRIDVDRHTPRHLAAKGIYTPGTLLPARPAKEAAHG